MRAFVFMLAATAATCLGQPAAVVAGAASARPGAPAAPPLAAIRDPFWPVGWYPDDFGSDRRGNQDRDEGTTGWEEAAKGLKVTGLTRKADGTYVAVLHGIGVVEKGDLIAVRHLGLTYRWRVRDITAQGLRPERVRASRDE